MHSLNHPLRRLRVFLASVILLGVTVILSAQEVRLKKYTREYESIVGTEVTSASTNYGPGSIMTKNKISIDWNTTDAGHNTRSLYLDAFYGGAGVLAIPSGSGVWDSLDYISDEWPAFPDLGTNFTYNGPSWLFSATNNGVLNNRSGAAFRYASYTNATSTNDSILGSDANGNPITLNTLRTNYVTEKTKWEAEVITGGESGSTKSYLYQINLKPTDDDGNFVESAHISFGTNTLDEFWNCYMPFQDCTTNSTNPTFAQAVKSANGPLNPWKVRVHPTLKGSGGFSESFLTNSTTMALLGTNQTGSIGQTNLGGPTVTHDGAIDPTAGDRVGHFVEVVCSLPPEIRASECTFKQTKLSIQDEWFFNGDQQITKNYTLENGNEVDDPGGDSTSQNGQTISMIDNPGTSLASLASWFTNPGEIFAITGSPDPGAVLSQYKYRIELKTEVFYKGFSIGEIKWYVEIWASGPDISQITTQYGTIPE